MSVNGVTFLAFLLLAVILYYLIPKGVRWIVLLCASVVFYLSYGWSAGLYLAVTIVLTYAFSLWLGRLAAIHPAGETAQVRKAQKKQLTHKKRLVLAAALVLNFLALGVLKYGAFFVSNVNRVIQSFGQEAFPLPAFLLPLGISFYIFQTSGYLIDLYRGKYPPQRNILRYALFVCYFPQMVQGPINRYDALAPALYEGNAFDWANLQHGLLRMMFGVLKKALIADALAPTVQELYTNFYAYPGSMAFLGAALYCIQLYCDFSGGIDLLCGASTLFGIPMQEIWRDFQRQEWKMWSSPSSDDLLERVAQDLPRKLAKGDRVVGPALCCLRHGRVPHFLAKVLAAAYYFKNEQDAGAQEVQKEISERGIEAAIERFSGLSESVLEEKALKQMVVARYYEMADREAEEIPY